MKRIRSIGVWRQEVASERKEKLKMNMDEKQ